MQLGRNGGTDQYNQQAGNRYGNRSGAPTPRSGSGMVPPDRCLLGLGLTRRGRELGRVAERARELAGPSDTGPPET